MTVIPLMDCQRVYEELQPKHDSAIAQVLKSGRYLMGEQVQSFESKFARYCGANHAVGVGNGTDALELSLRAINCGPQAEVVVAANAGMYAAAAAVLTGATPVFADVHRETLSISPESVRRVLTDRTCAVVVTHLYGRIGEVSAIREQIGHRPIRIIEDCAQAHGAGQLPGRAGSLGDMATFSFYPTKNLGALGDGGAVVTSDSSLAQIVRELAQYGWSHRYEADRAGGRNSRLDELQAAVLNVRLAELDRWNQHRREIVRRYREAAAGSGLVFVSSPIPEDACHLCVVRHPERDRVRKVFEQAGISTSVHFPRLDVDQPALRHVGWRADDLGESRLAQAEIFTLPCFPQLTGNEIARVCQTIRGLS